MAGLTVAVDPAEYAAAASQLSHVGEDAASAVITLVGVLEGSSGMAGSDPAGTSWAQEYDEAAKAALSASEGLVSAAGQVARLLHASGDNHSRADASSTAGGGDASMPAAPAPPDMSQPVVPSAAGGSGGGPFGWSLVQGAVGYVWPNGHQDRLLAAEAAWSAAAGGLGHAAGPVPAAAARVQAQQSPETAAASAVCSQVGSELGELSGVFTQIGQSCGQYATSLDHAHHEIISELKELVIETAAIEAGGAVLAFFTAGLDEIAAQAAVAARIAMVAAKIRRIIEALIEAARVVATAVRGFAGKALEILRKLKPLLETGVQKAKAAVVKGAQKVGADGAGDSVASQSAAGLSDAKRDEILALSKGSRPDPATYLSSDYIKSHLAKFDDGAVKFVRKDQFGKYGLGQADGTAFVVTKSKADSILSTTRGNPRALEKELGLPSGFLDKGEIVRVDIADPQDFNLRMPSGNEAGANQQWLPGGNLPTGAAEAVVDGAKVPSSGYTVVDVPK